MTMLRKTAPSLLVCSFFLLFFSFQAHAASDVGDSAWNTTGDAQLAMTDTGQPEPFMLDKPLPEVLTATRLRQPKTKVPASVTIIPGDLIQQLGITSLWDVFHLVPGMTVAFVASNKPEVSYHGTVAGAQRRLQVIIDGRSSYNIDLADVIWHTMPVALENIERIEVTRGPDAAAYGVNSFLAIINIITKSPQDTQGAVYSRSWTAAKTSSAISDVSAIIWATMITASPISRRESDGFDYRYAKNDGNHDLARTPIRSMMATASARSTMPRLPATTMTSP